MLSRNNWKEQVRQQEPKKQRFTIKKLTIGVASVLIGFTFMGMSASANGQPNNAQTKPGTPSVQPAQSGTDSKAITADSGQPNNAQTKPG
ncbi:YSIRK-type signal peptide-containing protein, partial [Limosilactobacillus reuteri]